MKSQLYTIISNKLWDLSLYFGDLYNRWVLASQQKTLGPCKCALFRAMQTYRVFSLTWPASMQIYWNKRSVRIRKEFNSQRIGLGHPHGRRDVMWKHSIQIIALASCWRLSAFKSPFHEKSIFLKIRCFFSFKFFQGHNWLTNYPDSEFHDDWKPVTLSSISPNVSKQWRFLAFWLSLCFGSFLLFLVCDDTAFLFSTHNFGTVRQAMAWYKEVWLTIFNQFSCFLCLSKKSRNATH